MQIINAWICQIIDNSILPIFGNMKIQEGKIVSISEKDFDLSKLDKPYNDETIDAQGRVVTIPNVNYHDHIYSRLAKGLDIKGDMSNFPNILKNLWWKLDSILDLDMIRASAQMAALESISNGVTYVIDHHSSPKCAKNSLSTISDELKKFSIRNVLCFETTDRNGEKLKKDGLDENQSFLNSITDNDSKSLLGLHASFTLNNETLEEASKLVGSNNWGIHVHLCEDISDVSISKEKFNRRPMQRFSNFNLLNEKSILAHGIHLNEEDFELIKNSGASLVFNIDSNMNNFVGLQKYKMIPADIPILVGTDGMHSNVARSTKQLFLQLRNSGLSFDDSFKFIIKSYFDQHKFVKQFFPDFTTLNLNDRADMIIWDYVPPAPINDKNFWGHYVYGILERPINTVIQKGKVLMNDFKIMNEDKSINNNIYMQGKMLSEKFNKE